MRLDEQTGDHKGLVAILRKLGFTEWDGSHWRRSHMVVVRVAGGAVVVIGVTGDDGLGQGGGNGWIWDMVCGKTNWICCWMDVDHERRQ